MHKITVQHHHNEPARRPRFRWLKSTLWGLAIIILSTLGINAADNFGNLSDSIVGRVLGGSAKCPDNMVFVTSAKGGFCIDLYENSAGNKCQFANPADLNQSQSNIDGSGCLPVTQSGNSPWTNITQEQAQRVCAKAGKRLPTNSEWQAAALGTPDKNENWTADDCQVANNWTTQPGPAGSGTNCLSFIGAYDMIGNVWEWIDGAATDGEVNGRRLPADGFIQSLNMNDDLPAETGPTPNDSLYRDYFWVKDSKTRGIIRGGYWANKSDAGQYSAYAVFAPNNFGSTIGFRCVK